MHIKKVIFISLLLVATGCTTNKSANNIEAHPIQKDEASKVKDYSQLGSTTPQPADRIFNFTHEVTGNKLVLTASIAEGFYLFKDRFKLSIDGKDMSPHITGYDGNIVFLKNDPAFGDVDVCFTTCTITIDLSALNSAGKPILLMYQGATKGLIYPPLKFEPKI